jgi:hypothetical protein
LTGAELNEVVGGLYPQPLPPGPPPELSRSILSIFRSFRNQLALHLNERIPPVLVLIYGEFFIVDGGLVAPEDRLPQLKNRQV